MKRLVTIAAGFVGSLVAILVLPLMILNMLGGLISAIWLLVLGEWKPVALGSVTFLFSGPALGMALIPSVIFAMRPAEQCERSGNQVGVLIFGFVGFAYTFALFSVWCMAVMLCAVRISSGSTLLPLLLWSYGVALSPILWLAKKDQEGGRNEFSAIGVLVFSVAYILTAGSILFGNPLGKPAPLFGAVVLLGVLLMAVLGYIEHRSERGLPD
ncbi:MAG TPA: hypothetical protein VEH04_11300 [Verrucomicrobiae bacterium]|nr:hypothetical protein [Verrucomicrobiae bacterium]